MAVAFVLVFAFLFFLFWGGVLPLKLCPFVATFTITHSCHVKGESCFFFHGKTFKNSELSYQYV